MGTEHGTLSEHMLITLAVIMMVATARTFWSVVVEVRDWWNERDDA
jgi:hypothetical protein